MRLVKQLCFNRVTSLFNKSAYRNSEVIYSFNKSLMKLALRFTDFSKLSLENILEYEKVGIKKYIYDIKDNKEAIQFL